MYFGDTSVAPANRVTGGWKGILYSNLAIINPQASFNFFSSSNFDPNCLDGGASQTWYLAFAAGKLDERKSLRLEFADSQQE